MARTRTRASASTSLFAEAGLTKNPATGTHCSVCGEPQVESPSGVTCKFGHGGVPSYEDERASGKAMAETVATLAREPDLDVSIPSEDPALPPIIAIMVDDRPKPTFEVEHVETPPVTIVLGKKGELDPTTKRHADRMSRASVPKAAKVAHVKAGKQTRDHTCHWPGCGEQVPPAVWGCKKHWFTLPKTIRDRIWAAYAPGQETTMTPSDAYLDAVDEAETWIREYEERNSPTSAPVVAVKVAKPLTLEGFLTAPTPAARIAATPQTILDAVLDADGQGHYLNPGEHVDDCHILLGGSCDCRVGYAFPNPEPKAGPLIAKIVGPNLTVRDALSRGYHLDLTAAFVAWFEMGKPGGDWPVAPVPIEPTKRAPIRPASSKHHVDLRFVPVPTRELVEIRTSDELAALLKGPRLEGAPLVKLAVDVRTSERESFDATGLKQKLLAHGAGAVMVAPRVVSDIGVATPAKVAAARAQSPEDAIREWFAGQLGLSDDERAEAIEIALDIMGAT